MSAPSAAAPGDEPDLNVSPSQVEVMNVHPRAHAFAPMGDADEGWLILVEPGGRALGQGSTESEAWRAARETVAAEAANPAT